MSTPVPNTSRLNPALTTIINRIKELLSQDGYVTVPEYKELLEAHPVDEQMLLTELLNDGIAYASALVGEGARAEVLVDIRLMAVAQLIAYADDKYAKSHLVLDFVKAVHSTVGKGAAYMLSLQPQLLADTYRQKGHRFTYEYVADRAIIENDGGKACHNLLARHLSALSALVKDDRMLTEVHEIARTTFQILNGHLNFDLSVFYKRGYNLPNSPHKHFYKMATVLINKHRLKVKRNG